MSLIYVMFGLIMFMTIWMPCHKSSWVDWISVSSARRHPRHTLDALSICLSASCALGCHCVSKPVCHWSCSYCFPCPSHTFVPFYNYAIQFVIFFKNFLVRSLKKHCPNMRKALLCMTSAFVDSALIRCLYSYKRCFLLEESSTIFN